MSRGVLSVVGLILAAISFLAVNVASNNALNSARLDLTQDRLFTLSDGSRNIIAALEEPITLRFYFSETTANAIPQIKTYGQRVRELIEEYVTLSGGRIRLEVIDPEPFTEAEDDAVRAGLQAVPLGAGVSLYFGLVGTNTVDDQQVVPFFSQEKEQFLEYDLTRIVYNLTDPAKPVVGLITAHQMNADVSPLMRVGGGGPQPWAITETIRETFTLRTVDRGAEAIDEDIDVLLIAHPAGLPDTLLYAIDQFVLRGGKALVYVDPFSEVAAAFGRQRGGGPDVSDLGPLLAAWGVALEEDRIVGDWAAAQQVDAGTPGRPRVMRYLPWLQVDAPNYDTGDVVMGELGPVAIATAGSIVRLSDGTTGVTPLITSSTQAMLYEADDVRFGPNPQALIENFKPAGDSFVLAARITGNVVSAFPDGPPAPAEEGAENAAADEAETPADETAADQPANGGEEPLKHLSESQQPINVILVADSDLLYDQFWLRRQGFLGQQLVIPIASNADMAVNALDNLAGSSDLISLRSRGKSARPFVVVEDLRRAAEQTFLAEERELRAKLEAKQQEINELEGSADAGGGALLTAEQQRTITEAREEILETRRQLRDVQHNLNKDIENLEARLKFANIGLIPIAIGIGALVLAGLRIQRRRRARHTD